MSNLNVLRRMAVLAGLLVLALLAVVAFRVRPHRVIADESVLFERVFHRDRPTGVNVANIEFYEFRSILGFVDEWQWFAEVESTKEFNDWLIGQDGFRLRPILEPGRESAFRSDWPVSPPRWFLPSADCDVLQSHDCRMTLYIEKSGGRVFITDWDIQ